MLSSAQQYAANWKESFSMLMRQLEQQTEPHIANTKKELIYRENKLRLFRYQPLNIQQVKTPILLCYALINRPDIVDLQDDRSLVLRLLEKGHPVYLIDWGYPDSTDCFTSLDDYINGLLHRCIQRTKRDAACEQVDLLGICQGGVFSLCYAALHPKQIRKLITIVTPVDCHYPGSRLSLWPQSVDEEMLSETTTNIPGQQLSSLFNALKPFQLSHEKYRQPSNLVYNKKKLLTFLRMEKWLNDTPDLAGLAAREFFHYFYQHNCLQNNSLQLGKQTVSLTKIKCPVLNFYASKDHIVPPASTQALRQHIDKYLYQEKALHGGHIGAFTSKETQHILINTLTDWLNQS